MSPSAIRSAFSRRMGPEPVEGSRGQNRGLGSTLFPYLSDVARGFGRSRFILWGGVHAINSRAIHFYEKNGFKAVGEFEDERAGLCIDMMTSLPDEQSQSARWPRNWEIDT